jgi:hypothetical protein
MFRWLFADDGSGYFTVAVISLVLATVCAVFIVNRMENLGFSVRDIWRNRREFPIFSGYWNIAPKRGWSRFPLVIMYVAFGIAMVFEFLTLRRH